MKNLLLLLFVLSCSSAPKKDKRQVLVLIQGVHLDDSGWGEVKTRLESDGYRVVTLNRLGRDLDHPASLKEMAELSCGAIPENSTIVAHSFGGAIVNQMMGVCPTKVMKIIYVSALVPLKGEKPFDRMSKLDQKEYSRAVDFDAKQIRPKSARTFFEVTDPSFQFDTAHEPKLYSESVTLGQEAIDHNQAIFDSVPKAYIYTLKDQVVSLPSQEGYVKRAKIIKASGVETGHFPMFSNPVALELEIVKWARD